MSPTRQESLDAALPQPAPVRPTDLLEGRLSASIKALALLGDPGQPSQGETVEVRDLSSALLPMNACPGEWEP